jgi:hypothetical protein
MKAGEAERVVHVFVCVRWPMVVIDVLQSIDHIPPTSENPDLAFVYVHVRFWTVDLLCRSSTSIVYSYCPLLTTIRRPDKTVTEDDIQDP